MFSFLIVDFIQRKRAGCFLWHLNRWQAHHGELALAKYMVRFSSIFYFFCGWGFHQFYIAYTRIWSPYLYKKRSCILLSSDGRMHVDAHTSTLPHLMHVRASFALGFFYFLLGFHFCVTSELDMLHTWAGILISSYKTSSVAADSIYLGFDRCIEHRPANQRASSECWRGILVAMTPPVAWITATSLMDVDDHNRVASTVFLYFLSMSHILWTPDLDAWNWIVHFFVD